MGKQCLSTKPRNAQFSFGSSTREQWTNNSYISSEHVRKNNTTALTNPGAKYAAPNALGKQANSLRYSYPQAGIGKEIREVSKVPKDLRSYPGPGEYKAASSMMKQPLSARPTSSNTAFGSGTRDGREKSWIGDTFAYSTVHNHRVDPGPGRYEHNPRKTKFGASNAPKVGTADDGFQKRFYYPYDKAMKHNPGSPTYTQPSGFRKQPYSLRVTAAAYGFGTSKMFQMKRYISKGHERELLNRVGPGPTTSPIVNSCGTQLSSVKNTLSEWSFDKRSRFDSERNNTFTFAHNSPEKPTGPPGLGKYDA